MSDQNSDFLDSSLAVILVIVYQIGVPISAFLYLVSYTKQIDGPLEFIGFMILSSIKGLFWPITMWF